MTKGYRLTFSKRGRNLSGKGHLARTRRLARQPGVLFEMDEADRDRLDVIEGRGAGYDRVDAFAVWRADARQLVTAFAYLASDPEPDLVPYDWYAALIVAGALEHRFDPRQVRALLSVPRMVDTDPPDGGREEAMGLLASAGAGDLAGFFGAEAERLLRAQPWRTRGTLGPPAVAAVMASGNPAWRVR